MITCTSCGTEQKESKFCGQCGALIAGTENIKEEKEIEVGKSKISKEVVKEVASVQAAAYKEKALNYWNYFVGCLKKPSDYIGEANFIFGLISTIVTILLYTLVPFTWVNKMMDTIYSVLNPVFNISNTNLGFGNFLSMFIYIAIFYALILVITFILSKKLGSLKSWKAGIAEVGAYNSYMIIALIIIQLLVFLNSLQFSASLYVVITLIFILLIPIYVAIKSYKEQHNLDGYIRFLITIAAYAVLYFIVYKIILSSISSAVGNMLNEVSNLFGGY